MTHPILNTSSSRTTVEVAELLLVEQLPVLLPGATLWVGKAQMTTAQAVAVLQAHRDAKAATDAAKQAWQAAVRAEHALAAEAKQVVVGARAYAAATLGAHSLAFDQLGFKAKAKAVPSTATLKAGIEKRNATRVARRTMGKKQRAAIKGAPPAAAPLAAAAPPSAAATSPSAAAASPDAAVSSPPAVAAPASAEPAPR